MTTINVPTSTAEILSEKPCTLTCNECGSDFDLQWPMLAALVKTCPECSEKHAIADGKRVINSSSHIRAENWTRICPLDFQATDRNKLPNQRATTKALDWRYGKQGLLLHGPTSRGKSRVAWLIAGREYRAGKSVIAMNYESGMKYAEKYSESARAAAQWVERRQAVDLLLWDDAAKSKLTDSYEAALFSILCARTERGMPMIVTTQDTGETIAGRMSEDRGAAMVRRLREFCLPVSF